MQDRLARERDFHDARFAESSGDRRADRFYAINDASSRFFKQQIEDAAEACRMLDYGCGRGAYAGLYAAGLGHDVMAIDISPVAIERARQQAARMGVAGEMEFAVMNAECLDFPDDSFDMVCGLGILHHLELEAALRECARILRPAGRAVFVEPLGYNPIINLYRNRTPEQRSIDEHPLVMSDVETTKRYFGRVTAEYFHLFDLLALPLRRRRGFQPSLHLLDAVDRVALRTPLRRYAWMVGLRLERPV